MGKHRPMIVGLPDPIGVNWLDQVEKVVSTGVIKATRISRAELHLVALPNTRRDKRVMKSLEKKKQKQLEREQEQRGKVTPE